MVATPAAAVKVLCRQHLSRRWV